MSDERARVRGMRSTALIAIGTDPDETTVGGPLMRHYGERHRVAA